MQFGKSSEKPDTQIAQVELEELEGEAIVAASRRVNPVQADRPSPVWMLPAHRPLHGSDYNSLWSTQWGRSIILHHPKPQATIIYCIQI